MKRFQISFTHLKKPTSIVVVHLSGSFDSTAIDTFEEEIEPYLEQGQRHFIFDCQHLEYINSNAINEILRIYHHTHNLYGFLYLVAVNNNLREILSMVGITQFIPVVDTTRDVLATIRK